MARAFASFWDGLSAFTRWWGEELRGLVPRGLRQLFQRSETRIVLAAEKGGLELYEERGSQLRPLDRKERGPAPAPKVLAQLKARKWRGPIGVRVPLDSCFVRAVELPASARADFGSILSLDLERATPFRAGEVYTAHYVEDERPTGGKLKVRQLVVKREAIVPLVADAEAIGLDVNFADTWNESRSGGLPINFLAPDATAATSARPTTARRVLAAAAALLLISAGYLLFHRYDSALSELEAATAQAKVKAQSIRQVQERSQAAANELAALRRIKVEQPSSVEIVEEVTRLLPDSAWVSHLRIDKDTVELTGVAQSGAGLLPLLERSPLFVDAKLTAPLRFDEQENGERFSIKMRLRRAAGASSAEDKG